MNEKESIKLLINNTQFPVGKSPYKHSELVTQTSVKYKFLSGSDVIIYLFFCFSFCMNITVIFTNYTVIARSSQ